GRSISSPWGHGLNFPEFLFREALLDFLPVHDAPPGRDVVGAAVLILEVIGVLPNVEAHDGNLAFHHGAVLIRGGGDFELAGAILDQPGPTRAEAAHAGGSEPFFE